MQARRQVGVFHKLNDDSSHTLNPQLENSFEKKVHNTSHRVCIFMLLAICQRLDMFMKQKCRTVFFFVLYIFVFRRFTIRGVLVNAL